MKFIVDFYKSLDAVNLLIFWGVIIVVLFLLIFDIIISNKNRKLEKILEKSGIDIDNYDDRELAIKTAEEEKIEPKEEKPISIEPVTVKETQEENTKELTFPTLEEHKEQKNFIAEEHIMEYNEQPSKTVVKEIDEPIVPNIPYQRNVLREMSSNQTSPIGIAKNNSPTEREMNSARELHEALNEEMPVKKDTFEEETLINQKKYVDTYNQSVRKGDYLEQLSQKLSNVNNGSDIDRTPYELKQEEDAIISYEELMQKKDNIKTIDEEDAVISINELIEKKKAEEKIYNITKDEDDDEFISELKNFRGDL